MSYSFDDSGLSGSIDIVSDVSCDSACMVRVSAPNSMHVVHCTIVMLRPFCNTCTTPTVSCKRRMLPRGRQSLGHQHELLLLGSKPSSWTLAWTAWMTWEMC